MVAFQDYFYRLSLFIEYLFYIKTSCGECQFKMKGKGCSLAIKLDGKNYFVANANIDDYGDAHEKKGFCNSIRKAKVQGQVVDGKFVASYFELVD